MTNETPVAMDGLNELSLASRKIWENYMLSSLTRQMQYASGANTALNTTPIDSNRQFIKLEQSFLNQIKQHPEFFGEQNSYLHQERMKLSADALLNCNPDKISLQITDEGSVFYTILKNGLTIYFQHFLVDIFDGTDEAIVTVYEGGKSVINFGGTLAEAFNNLSEVLASYYIALPVFVS